MQRRVYPCAVDPQDSLRIDNDFSRHPNSENVVLQIGMTDGSEFVKHNIYLAVDDVLDMFEQLRVALERYPAVVLSEE